MILIKICISTTLCEIERLYGLFVLLSVPILHLFLFWECLFLTELCVL